MNNVSRFKKFRIQMIAWIVFLATVLVMPQLCLAASTQQIISNMAIGEYSEEGSSVVQVSRSNLVQTTVLPLYSVNLSSNNIKTVVAGQKVYFNHTLTNTGNETDQYTFTVSNNTSDNYDLTDFSVFLDKDNDGVPDGPAITSYALSAGDSVGLIVVATVPTTVTVDQKGIITLNVSSSNNASGTKANIDTTTVTNQSALIVRKKFSQTTVASGDVITVRLDYQNLTNTATGVVTLTDTLDSSLLYQANSGENWNGVTVNPSEGSNDPTGINYSVTSNVVRAVISTIAANSSGYLEFKVKINKSNAGVISNVVNTLYDHDNNSATANISDVSNTAVVNVAPIYNVKINGSANDSSNSNVVTATPTTQGGEITLNNYVWNTGNATDRFNVTFAGNTFPAGSQIELYRIDGATPLLDSNGDGIPDTGLLPAGAYFPIIVKVRFPSSYAVTADTTFDLSVQAQSVNDITKKNTIKDQGTLATTPSAQLVDLVNSPENNAVGNGNVDNAGAPWKTLQTTTSTNTVAGGQVVFPLTVTHHGTGTQYILSANSSSDFTQMVLPSGINKVRFYIAKNDESCSTLGNEIGKTRYLSDGESQLVCAVVEVDPMNKTVTTPIYFRVLSTSFVSTNNSSNPSQDIIKNAITIQSVNAQNQVEFMPSARGQVAPLGTVVYRHYLVNRTDTDLATNYRFVVNNDQNGFQSTLFYDVNENGIFDSGDLILGSLADLPNGKLAAHQQINVLLQVKNLASNNSYQSNSTIVNLTNASTNQIVASITDVTTVNQVQLKLNKLQARDFDCDGAADEPYTSNSLNIGKQDNAQGQCILYKITLTNISQKNLETVFTFRDMTPAYTVLFQTPNCSACSGVTAPTVGSSGAVSGTLSRVAANQSYDFNFGVRYVGQ